MTLKLTLICIGLKILYLVANKFKLLNNQVPLTYECKLSMNIIVAYDIFLLKKNN